jgi:hypothetical protein
VTVRGAPGGGRTSTLASPDPLRADSGPPPDPDGDAALPSISVVVIGRNEGAHLTRCFESVLASDYPRDRLELVYVDSGSDDGSVDLARRFADRVIAARIGRARPGLARNLGWRQSTRDLVQFVDGDSVLDSAWLRTAAEALGRANDALCVFGVLREMRPEANLYHRALGFEWEGPAQPRTSGGIVMFPRARLDELGGFDETLEAGEEPDLCTRGRLAGYRLLRLDRPMARHDLDMRSFGAYWRRGMRSGHAYALIGTRFARTAVPLWRRELRNNLIQLAALVAGLALLGSLVAPLPALGAVVAAGVLLVARKFLQVGDPAKPAMSRLAWAVHVYLVKLPIWCGHLRFFLRKLLGKGSAATVEVLECWSRAEDGGAGRPAQCQADQSPVART